MSRPPVLPMPVRYVFGPNAPRVKHDAFLTYHDAAMRRMTGRAPTAFERSVASFLKETYHRMPTRQPTHAFASLSAATGGGKTTGACALMAFLAESEGRPSAYVAPSIAVAEEAHANLCKLLPKGAVACWTSIHKAGASPRTVADYAANNDRASAQYTAEEFLSARVVVTTHEQWKRAIALGDDPLSVLSWNGNLRTVFVDEDPQIESVFARQSADIADLADLLSESVHHGEARAFGFLPAHAAAGALRAIVSKMGDAKDAASVGAFFQSAEELVSAEELELVSSITREELSRRALEARISLEQLALHWGTVEFLKMAAQGRVFYSRADDRGAFIAYGMPVKAMPHHIILDGTADMTSLSPVGRHLSVVSALPANYSRVNLYSVAPPRELRGRMSTGGTLKNASAAAAYFAWFMPFLLERTRPGQKVLVYAKKRLLEYEIHKSAEYDDSAAAGDATRSNFQGREISWCNFGRGRGLNRWKECEVYFRLGDFMQRRSVMMARVAAATGEQLTAADLLRLNSGAVRDPRIDLAQDIHLATSNKQDAMRCAPRVLDDDGFAAAADLYMVDCDLSVLTQYREAMFPESRDYVRIDCEPRKASVEGARGDGGARRVAEMLLTTDGKKLSVAEVCERGDIRPAHFAHTLSTHTVQDAMRARGWQMTTRRAQGLPGKGKLLIRAA